MKDKTELLPILKDLHTISGFRISIYDTNLNEIIAYPKELSTFCALLQKDSKVRACCVRNDADAFEIVKKTDEVHIYKCQFGLYEAVAPLYHFGVLTGYLMMGQTIDSKNESRENVYENASPYTEDKLLLKDAIDRIPASTKQKIRSCISIMNICAEYISLSNRLNLSDKDLAHAVRKYINKNFSQKITMDSLASHFFYSKPTIMDTFKKTYHISISRHLLEVRMKHASKLLANTSDSINSISMECGFSDQNYFSKVFFKEYGATPSEYRKRSASS